MASSDKRPAPTRRTGGRVTPKGGPSPKKGDPASGAGGPEASTRYTPPVPKSQTVSPVWVPWLMLALFALGVVVIFLHYTEALLPGAASNWWLFGGLGFILAGIITATQYR
ncbi:cell division protein CrgA [Rhabdothermincola salaria]|uniref:cell division protein CrgA n=1 Tax=Rhabdothermincola salaria TaxID=2903142 RepID=UPI001E47785B|nr:cell division protein CrgA [Rhabdothermincola salaria]MCD9624135.1 cell division protein CrgA [Rhabdothermincola salaria]